MKTMRNEYRDLKKENDLIFSTLAEYDRDILRFRRNSCNV